MSDTPRTDAAVELTSQHRYDYSFGDPNFGWVTAGFARELERENAALREDKERLDWLEKQGFEHCQCETGDSMGWEWVVSSESEEPNDIRAAIDAARKEGK